MSTPADVSAKPRLRHHCFGLVTSIGFQTVTENSKLTQLLSREMTAGEALVCLVGHCTQSFVRHLPPLMLTSDPEGTHRTRVALRRLRSVLDGFRPILDKAAIAPLKAEARMLFRLIGQLRDAEINARALAATPGADTRAKDVDDLRITVRAALTAQDAQGFAARAASLLHGKTWRRPGRKARERRNGPVRVLAELALEVAWGTCAAYGPDLAGLTPECRHGFRKDMKTLRYLSDFFLPLWPKRNAKAFYATMEALQDELGILTDIASICGLIVPDEQAAADQDRKAVAALTKACNLWRKLADQGVWWR